MHSYTYKPTQSNKIIDGCQGIIDILADKKNSCSQKCSYAIWLKLRKRKWNSQHVPPCGKGLHKVAAPYFLIYLHRSEDWGILHMLGCWVVALPSTKQIVSSSSPN